MQGQRVAKHALERSAAVADPHRPAIMPRGLGMRMRLNSIIGIALLLAACGNADQAQAPAASTVVAEAQSPAALISEYPHPAEMATHCLRVLGAGLDDARAERCKVQHLWAASTGRTGPLSDRCLLHRLTSDAYSPADTPFSTTSMRSTSCGIT